MRITLNIMMLLLAYFTVCAQDGVRVSDATEDSSVFRVTRLPLNSPHADFSPFVLNDRLWFISARTRNLGIQYVDMKGNSEITDIYSAVKIDSLRFGDIKPEAVFNTRYHEGPFCFNSQGIVIYFTANDKKTDLLRIYTSEYKKGSWSKPRLMPFCRPEYSYCHPALSPDGDFMVFAASINKTKSGMDLYRSDYSNGSWSEPVRLNENINTPANEVFPFVGADHQLYFSSDKKNGMGGFDIYSVRLDTNTGNVVSLSHPFNSEADDFGIWIDPTSASGYFSSSRQARYKDDIYYFYRHIPDFSKAKTIVPKLSYCYSFFEESTLASKDTLLFSYEWDFGDNRRGKGQKTRHCYTSPGSYCVRLNIIDKTSGEVLVTKTSYTLDIERRDLLNIQCNEQILCGRAQIFNSSGTYIKDHRVEKVYWSFGDGRYNTGTTVEHRYRRDGVYTVEIGVLARNLKTGKAEQFRAEKKITVINCNQ